MPLELFDTHAHLDDGKLRDQAPDILQRAAAAGVLHIVTVATTANSSAACVALAKQHQMLSASVGIHPNHAAEAAADDWDRVIALVDRPEVVAVGETGLDRHWDFTPFPVQEEFFARHLRLARQHGKPVVIHCREAEADVLRMLRDDFDRAGPIHGVMHSFAGAWATAEACLAMGLHISFAGMVTYKNAQELRELAARIAPDRIMVETDSPYLSPAPVRGRINEPAHIAHTAACLAGVRNLEVEEFAQQTTRNARALFCCARGSLRSEN